MGHAPPQRFAGLTSISAESRMKPMCFSYLESCGLRRQYYGWRNYLYPKEIQGCIAQKNRDEATGSLKNLCIFI